MLNECQLKVESHSSDVIVSFETIEHLVDKEAFLIECKRVLRRGGKIVVSSPNRDGSTGEPNVQHADEMNVDEFQTLIKSFFGNCRMYTQFPRRASCFNVRCLSAENCL